MSGPGGRPDRRHLGGQAGRLRRTSSRSTSAAPRPTSASPPAGSCACATCSTRRSATTRRWCRWSTSTRSAPAAARSPTSTRAACSASARSRRAPIPARPATAAAARSRPRPTRSSCSGACVPTAACSAATCSLDVDLARAGDAAARRPARDVRRGGRARRAPDPEVRHDAGDRAELGAPRLRPARVHARRRRRRRAAVCLRHRAGARDPARARPAAPGHHRRHRAARHRPPARVRRHRAPPAEDARPGAAAAPLRRARPRRPSRSSIATACPRTGGWCGASPTAATRARATRCASTCRPATSTTPGSRS